MDRFEQGGVPVRFFELKTFMSGLNNFEKQRRFRKKNRQSFSKLSNPFSICQPFLQSHSTLFIAKDPCMDLWDSNIEVSCRIVRNWYASGVLVGWRGRVGVDVWEHEDSLHGGLEEDSLAMAQVGHPAVLVS